VWNCVVSPEHPRVGARVVEAEGGDVVARYDTPQQFLVWMFVERGVVGVLKDGLAYGFPVRELVVDLVEGGICHVSLR
jgi:hypothetical protein